MLTANPNAALRRSNRYPKAPSEGKPVDDMGTDLRSEPSPALLADTPDWLRLSHLGPGIVPAHPRLAGRGGRVTVTAAVLAGSVALVGDHHAKPPWLGIALAAGRLIFEPGVGVAKNRTLRTSRSHTRHDHKSDDHDTMRHARLVHHGKVGQSHCNPDR